jgi:hypothetical protein
MILASNGIIASQIQQYAFLLDTYTGAAAAYSLRKLRSAYTGSAIRVRRSSDNAEQDIGFSGGNLDTTALTSFCGAGNGFVTTWYDQSGNGNNSAQSTAANQPQIVSSGSVILINGKPSLLFDGTNDGMNLTSSITGNQPTSQFLVQKMNSQVSFMGFCGPASGGGNTLYGPTMFPIYSNTFYMRWQQGYIEKAAENITTQLIMSGIGLSSSGKYYRNNSLQTTPFTSAPLTNNYTQLGYGNDYSNAYAQEAIIYSSDQDSNVSGINTNINTYYSVY